MDVERGCAVFVSFERSWCRDEACSQIGLHLVHEHQGEDFSEQLKEEARGGLVSKSKRPPWKRPAPKALDHSIAKAVSKTYPKHLEAILRDVEDDYGVGESRGALYRSVGRHLAKLVERGHIIRIDLGRRLYAYVRPGSALVNDIELVREQILEMIDAGPDASYA